MNLCWFSLPIEALPPKAKPVCWETHQKWCGDVVKESVMGSEYQWKSLPLAQALLWTEQNFMQERERVFFNNSSFFLQPSHPPSHAIPMGSPSPQEQCKQLSSRKRGFLIAWHSIIELVAIFFSEWKLLPHGDFPLYGQKVNALH